MSNIIDCEGGRSSPSFIKYFPRIKSYTGCEKATVITGRLEFWFSKYQSGFYKFLEPCGHGLYRVGDSWSEELGFSRKVFNRAFDLIGIRYKSKSEFKSAEDKFQGKLYASYHDRKTNRTYFVRNHALAQEFFRGRGGDALRNTSLSQSPKGLKPETKIKDASSLPCVRSNSISNINVLTNTEPDHNKRAVPGTATLGRSINNNLKQKKTPSLKDTRAETQVERPDDFGVLTEGMILIWKEEVGDLGVQIVSSALLSRLYQTLSRFFSGSLEMWKSFCRKIASSKFLMGEAKNRFFKKAWITWAIKEDSIDLIRAGHFNCGDRELPKSSEVIALDAQLQAVRAEKEKLLLVKSRIEDEVRQKRKLAVRNAISEMTSESLQEVRDSFETEMQTQDSATGEAFREMGWRMPFAEMLFEAFLMEKFDSGLFPSPLAVQVEQVLEASGVVLQLKQFEIQETELISKLNEMSADSDFGSFLATNLNEGFERRVSNWAA